MFGFLNIYKPAGKTSHDIVYILRKLTGIKQIGHTGTLDPFAVGVLPICIGKSTRLIEYLDDDKQYIATIQFGKNTDTYDIDGKVTEEFDVKVDKVQVVNALKNFEGEIEQIPPKYSAIKVNGKKLYDYARQNQEVVIKPRKVNIDEIKLLEFDEEMAQAKVSVSCSKGTYIRSIAYDLGKILGCGAFLAKLERTKAGKFEISKSVKLENLNSKDDVKNNIINPLEMLNYEKYELSANEYKIISNGGSIICEKFDDEDIVFLVYSDNIKGVGIKKDKKIVVRKVL